MEFKKILVAVDDTANAIRAAETGFTLAHSLGARTGLIFVVDRSREVVNADLGITSEQSETVLLAEAEKTIEQLTANYAAGAPVDRFTPEGSPEKEILKTAMAWKADMIVMGTHHKNGLDRLLSRSATDHVIRHTVISVLVVP